MQLTNDVRRCPKCGSSLTGKTEDQEHIFYSGEGTLTVFQTKHKSTGTKVASFLAGGVIGYALFGMDDKNQVRTSGRLLVTNKSIYCAGNEYPLNTVLNIAKKDDTSAILQVNSSLTSSQSHTVEFLLSTDDMDEFLEAVEAARLSKVIPVDVHELEEKRNKRRLIKEEMIRNIQNKLDNAIVTLLSEQQKKLTSKEIHTALKAKVPSIDNFEVIAALKRMVEEGILGRTDELDTEAHEFPQFTSIRQFRYYVK
jgi:hypothetical protein